MSHYPGLYAPEGYRRERIVELTGEGLGRLFTVGHAAEAWAIKEGIPEGACVRIGDVDRSRDLVTLIVSHPSFDAVPMALASPYKIVVTASPPESKHELPEPEPALPYLPAFVWEDCCGKHYKCEVPGILFVATHLGHDGYRVESYDTDGEVGTPPDVRGLAVSLPEAQRRAEALILIHLDGTASRTRGMIAAIEQAQKERPSAP